MEIVAFADGENDVVLAAAAAFALLERDGFRIAGLRLRDEPRGVGGNPRAGRFDFFLRGEPPVAAEDNLLAVKDADGEIFEVGEDHVALVGVAEPIGGQRRQQRALAEVVADDLLRERQQGAVVGELGTDAVDDGHAFFADAMHEPRHAEDGIAAENHGVEPAVRKARVDDIDLVQAGDGFEVDLVVEDEEVAALHERDAHAAAEEAVLRIRGAERPGREEDDHGVRLRREGAQHFDDARGRVGNRVDAGVVERLGDDAREGAAVLHHVGNARGVREIVVLRGERAVGQPANGDAAEVQARRARRGEPVGGALEKIAAEDGRDRNRTVEEDFFLRINIGKEHLEGAQALADSCGQGRPLGGGENLGEQVAEPGALGPGEFAVDVEGDAHLAHRGFEAAVEGAELRIGHISDAGEERAVNFARLAVGAAIFVEGAEMPAGAHAAWRDERMPRAVVASVSMARRSSPGPENFFSGRR